jgi:hypothetical protein
VLWGGWVPKVSQGDIEFRLHVGLISQQMNTSKVPSSSELRATLADLVMVKPGYLYYQACADGVLIYADHYCRRHITVFLLALQAGDLSEYNQS